jgi:signal transduction histidine kinase
LALSLAPTELENFGIHAALGTHCKRQALEGGWNLHMDAPAPDARAPRPVEKACFRVLQEGLNHVLHHAKATEVWVGLRQSADELELEIRGNGIGFEPNAVGEDYSREGTELGLLGMQIRAKLVGGSVDIKSTAGAATELRAVFPLSVASDDPV